MEISHTTIDQHMTYFVLNKRPDHGISESCQPKLHTVFVCGAFPGLLLTIVMIVFIVIH